MERAILVGGILLTVLLLFVELRREWRLPALAFAMLAIPGNVDNYMPSMVLDVHALPNNTAPAISVLDALIVWAVVLTIREQWQAPDRRINRVVWIALGLVAVVIASGLTALIRGVEFLAVVRGILLFCRIVAVLLLAAELVRDRGDSHRIALGVGLGSLVLLGNGVYTSITQHQDRFTASTFGRNDFAVALILAVIIIAGASFDIWARRSGRTAWVLSLVGFGIAAAAFFGAVATGSRIALVALAVGGGVGLVINPRWRSRPGLARVLVVVACLVAVTTLAAVATSEGGRAVSVVTDPGAVLDPVKPGTVDVPSEVQSRTQFWELAVRMTSQAPITGVGPYQWNIRRYDLGSSTVVVADPHDSYLQLSSEYGIPALLIYLALVATSLGWLVLVPIWRQLRRLPVERLPWLATAYTAAGVAFVITDVTNSNLFNVRTGAFSWLLVSAALALFVRLEPARREAVRSEASAVPVSR